MTRAQHSAHRAGIAKILGIALCVMASGCAELSAPDEGPALRRLEQSLEVPCNGRIDVNRDSPLPEMNGSLGRFRDVKSLTIEFYRDGQATPFFVDRIGEADITNDYWFYTPPEDLKIGVDRLRVEVASGEVVGTYECAFALEPSCPPLEVITTSPRPTFTSQAPPGATITYKFTGPEVDPNPQVVIVPSSGPSAGQWVLQPPSDLYVGDYDVTFTVRLDDKIEGACQFFILVDPAPLKHSRCASASPQTPAPAPLGLLLLSATLGATLLVRRRP